MEPHQCISLIHPWLSEKAGGLRTKEASEGEWPRSYGESNENEIQSVQKGERSCWQ